MLLESLWRFEVKPTTIIYHKNKEIFFEPSECSLHLHQLMTMFSVKGFDKKTHINPISHSCSWYCALSNLYLQLSQRAGEIYNSFLSSKATMPVNIDSQAQLADDVLTSPQPDMFKTQQLQVPETLQQQWPRLIWTPKIKTLSIMTGRILYAEWGLDLI